MTRQDVRGGAVVAFRRQGEVDAGVRAEQLVREIHARRVALERRRSTWSGTRYLLK
jgi:hypothetical protein